MAVNKEEAGFSQHETKNNKSYPFHIVVVTFPDQGAATVAAAGPLLDLGTVYPDTLFLATCDPLGCRCGSGGGTLAALEQVEGHLERTEEATTTRLLQDKTILILHAGGDSSRCFTQMALGKAWTNLPIHDATTGDLVLSNPIHVGMDSIARIFRTPLPPGSIVVAASDALLSIPHYTKLLEDDDLVVDLVSNDDDDNLPDVLGVAFPAPWETAKNHGVYVLSKPNSNDTNQTKDIRTMVVPIQKVLQKPSLEDLQQEPFLSLGGNMEENMEGYAWIDNGIIAFLPRAAKALQSLASTGGVLHTSTQKGLLRAYEQRKATEPNVTCQDCTHKIDLYTHFLQALTIGEQDMSQHKTTYLREHASGLHESVALGILEALSPFQFQCLAVPEGKFLHLGTTQELMGFYIHGCHRTTNPISNSRALSRADSSAERQEIYTRNCTFFGQELGMVRRMGVFGNFKPHDNDTPVTESTTNAIGKDCVLMGSVVVGSPGSVIEGGTVMEFCCFDGSPVIQIGKNCFLSGLRTLPNNASMDLGPLRIPDNVCMQMVPLTEEECNSNATDTSRYVCMALGVNDPIKSSISESTLFGMELDSLLEWIGLTLEDIWDDSSHRNVWNAKLHPVFDSGFSFASLWDWLNYLPRDGSETVPLDESAKESLSRWKNQPRLSLSQVRDLSDGAREFQYRHNLLHSIIPARRKKHCQQLAEILWQRRHDECDFSPLLADTMSGDTEDQISGYISPQAHQALQTLDAVIQEALLKEDQYDVCGRTLMVLSAFLDDLAMVSAADTDADAAERAALSSDVRERCSPPLKTIRSPTSPASQRQQSYSDLVSLRGEYLNANNGSPSSLSLILKEFSEAMESIAHTMTEICVSGFLHDNNAISDTSKNGPIQGQWVIATAPARVDLSGGWSDTPPVCYEYGSAVTGVAITVDGKKPLSCRCRISVNDSNQEGVIFVRSEGRDSKTCELTSPPMDVTLRDLSDMRDARDPTAPCALIKCALICLGMISLAELEQDQGENNNLQSYVNRFCQTKDSDNARLEIVVTSLLPQGSGLGTSSILGGCVLAAVGRCVGIEYPAFGKTQGRGDSQTNIIDAVSVLEQVLSTGGGFQDQVNGLIGGLKIVSSKACELPIRLDIQQVEIDPDFHKTLDDSLVLAFSGKTRLAKNILQNVLRRWARRTPEVVETVKGLVEGAHEAKTALQRGDLTSLGACLDAYYTRKKHMAGGDSGVEPDLVRRVLEDLRREKAICGASLCGAGGGGFLVMLAAPGVSRNKIHAVVEQTVAAVGIDDDDDTFSWHDCHLSDEGLTTFTLPISKEDSATVPTFDPSWYFVGQNQDC